MHNHRRFRTKRLVSMTLACLMTLYSLPPAVHRPASMPSASNPNSDDGMLVRHALAGLDPAGAMGAWGHQLWHMAQYVEAGMSALQRLALTTPLAEAFHHYTAEVPSQYEIVFKDSGEQSGFTKPPSTPNAENGAEYEYVPPFGDLFGKWKKASPLQRSPHTYTLPLLDRFGKDPQDVEYTSSYFSEHSDAKGYGLFSADHLTDTSVLYPRIYLKGAGGSRIIQPSGLGVLTGYKNEWHDWTKRESYPGSGFGNFDEPKWLVDGVNLAFKEHPYWRFKDQYNFNAFHETARFASFDGYIKKAASIYYWETQPAMLATLNKELQDRNKPPVKGFWVEVQPFPANVFGDSGFSDYPWPEHQEPIAVGVGEPMKGPRNAQKFNKLVFYKPQVPANGGYIGFLSGAEAVTNSQDHDPTGDYVCVGAFAAYPQTDSVIAQAIARLRDSLWAEKQKQQATEEAKKILGPAVPADLLEDAAEIFQMLSDEDKQDIMLTIAAGPEGVQLVAEFFARAKQEIDAAKQAHTFNTNTDPTSQAGEPNATTVPPELFAQTLSLDPVNVTNGAQYYDHYDLQLPGRGMRTDFLRTYNSNFEKDFSSRNLLPLGHGWTHTYHQFLHRFPDGAIAYYNEHGKSTVFMPNGNNFRAPVGVPLTLTKRADGSYEVRDQHGYVLHFSGGLKRIATKLEIFHEPGIERFGTEQPIDAGRLLSITDRNGNRFELTYTAGKLTRVSDPAGRALTFAYQGDRLTAMTDPAGRAFTYRYTGDTLTEVIHPGARRQVYTYAGHLMTSHSDLEASQAWRFNYTGSKVSEVLDPEGNRHTFAYSGTKTVQTSYEVDGRAFVTEFDHQNGDITRKKDPRGTVITYEYDHHRKTKETFNRGDRTISTSYAYDGQGNMTRFTDASGQTTDIQYGPHGQPASVKTPAGTTTFTLDTRGNITAMRDPLGRTAAFQVDGQGQIQAVTDPGSHKTTVTHDARGLLTHVDTPLGGWTTYTYNGLGQVTSAADPTGTRRYDYDAKSHLKSLTDQLGRQTSFETDANGNVTRMTAPGGRVTQLSYNNKNQLVRITDPAGAETRYAYSTNGQLYTITNALGKVTKLERDGNGRVTRIVNANGGVKTLEYDRAGNVTRFANELDEATRYAYDALNRVTAVTDPDGNATAVEYHWLGIAKRVTDALGRSTEFRINAVGQLTDVIPPAPQGAVHYVYNADGTLASIQQPKGQTRRFTYNAANQVLTETDTRKTVQYEYDSLGRMTGVTAPRGRKATMRYDALGRLTTVTDALGNPLEHDYHTSGELKSTRKVNGALTTYLYDAAGRLTEVSAPEGRRTQMVYDKLGNVIEQVSPSGARSTYAYDALNRLIELNDIAKGAQTAYRYNAAGRMVSVVDPNGQSTSVDYDRLGRPTQVNAPLNRRTTMAYDALGNLLKETDANGHSRAYTYNANNRLTRLTDALGHQMLYDYDALGNLTEIKRLSDGATTRVDYNDLNLPAEVVDALNHRTRVQYDEFGNRTTLTDAKNRVTRYDYDALNRPTAVFEPLGRTSRMAYDRVGNLETVTNALGASTRMVYDLADRLRYTYEPLGRTTEFRYNALDQITLVRDANGNQNTVSYDLTGRPVREMNGLGHSTDFFYDRLDRLTRVTDALGRNTQYQYDALSRLSGVTDALGNQTRYRYDPVGNLLGVTDARGRQNAFNYDALDRVVLERDPLSRTTQYTYSSEGTLAQLRDGNGRTRSLSHDRLDRVVSLQTPDDFQTFAYDEVGNLVTHQNRTLRTQNRYDDLDRLVEERNLSWNKSTMFGYDVLGRMTSITTAMGRTARYTYDELDQLRALTDPEGHRTNYQYDRGGRLTRTDLGNGNRTLYGYDPADHVRSIMHQGRAGQTLQGYSYDYDRVGNRTHVQEPDGHQTRYSYDPLNRLQEVAYPIAAVLAERKGFLPDMATRPSTTGTQPVAQTASTVSTGSSGLPALSSASSGLGTSTRKVLSVQDVGGPSANNGNAGDPEKDKNPDANGNGWANGQDKNPDANGNGNANGQNGNQGGNGNSGNNGNNGQNGNGNGQSEDPDKDKNPDANGNGNAYGQKKRRKKRSAPLPSAPVVTTPGATPMPTAPTFAPNVTASPTATPAPEPSVAGGITPPQVPQGNGNGPNKGNLPPGQQGNWGAHNQPYWDEPVASVRYSYDQVGNRTSEVSERGTTTYSYDEANQLRRKVVYSKRPTPAVANPSHPHHADETTYQYDQNGNRIAETSNKAGESKQLVTTRYDYDTLNQLTGIQYPEGRKARYAYDPMGRLVEANRPHLPGDRPVQAEVRRFGYAGRSVVSEWDGGLSPMAEFYHGNGELVAKRLFGRQKDFNQYGVISPHETFLYFQHDALGSVSGLSNSAGAPVMRYRQDAFGNPLAGILEPHNTQMLTEKRFDTQSGLYYFGSRWYDPGSGRFMNQDSYRGALAQPMSQHRYAYVHNNPTNLIDVWGYNAQWKPQPYDFNKQRLISAAMMAGGVAASLFGFTALLEKGTSMWNNAGFGVREDAIDLTFIGLNLGTDGTNAVVGNGASAIGIGTDGKGSVSLQEGRLNGAGFQSTSSLALVPPQNEPKAPISDDFGMQAAADQLVQQASTPGITFNSASALTSLEAEEIRKPTQKEMLAAASQMVNDPIYQEIIKEIGYQGFYFATGELAAIVVLGKVLPIVAKGNGIAIEGLKGLAPEKYQKILEMVQRVKNGFSSPKLPIPRAVGAAPRINLTSRIKDSSKNVKLAENLSEQAQRDVDNLLEEFAKGNNNAGLGTRSLKDNFFELRGRNGGRVIIKNRGGGEYDIVAKFQGHKLGDNKNSELINSIIDEYKKRLGGD